MQYHKITFEDLPVIKKYLVENENQGCDFSLGNVYMWNINEMIQISTEKNFLVFRAIFAEKVAYYMTGSGMNDWSQPEKEAEFRQLFQMLLEDAEKLDKKLRIAYVTEGQMKYLDKWFPGFFSYTYNRNDSDYIYSVQELTELSGKKFHGKKNHINKFLRMYDYKYEEITKENIPECRKMKEEWGRRKVSDNETTLEEDLDAAEIAFEHFDELELKGGLIRIDGEVVAFTIGEPLTKDTFVTHLEKAYDDIPGLYTIINQQFAERTINMFTYVNREEDMGIEGLRKAKLSYQPVMLWNKYMADYINN